MLPLVAVVGIRQGEAAAESEPQFTSMAISVMPEYDQPRVLVAYRGELNPEASLPMQIRLRLPADTTVEHACSLQPPNDEHICQQYSVEPDGQYLALTYELVTPIMYVEFYYGSIAGAGQRSLGFTFWPPYPVQSLDVMVQEPLQASDFTLTPAPSGFMESQGFRHYTYSYQGLTVDNPVNLQMAYARPTDQPSVPARGAAAAAGAGGSDGIPQEAILLLALAGAAILGLVLYSAFGRRFRLRLVAIGRGAERPEGGVPQAGTLFCRHCGHRVRREFAFCPNCGQGVRRPPEEQP